MEDLENPKRSPIAPQYPMGVIDDLATMANGLPYALGIQHAFPGRQVIAYVGDGGSPC